MKNCSVCTTELGKYKCPTCLVYYCSVTCCKKHRENKCELSQVNVSEEPKAVIEPQKFITRDTVRTDQLDLLRHDKDVKEALSNPHLRELLRNLDSCDNPDQMIQKAMLEPLFTELADACLKIVGT